MDIDITRPTYSFSEERQKLVERVEKGHRDLTNPKDCQVLMAQAVELCLEEAVSALQEAVHDAARKIFSTYSNEAFGLIVEIFEKQAPQKH